VLLGNLRGPTHPPAPSVVRLTPADEQLIRYVREALVEQLRSAPEARIALPPRPPRPTLSDSVIKGFRCTQVARGINQRLNATSYCNEEYRVFPARLHYTGISCTCLAFSVAAARRN
jgi:hypothetical protein